MQYNQKRSRVHKTAVTMMRAGIKQLAALEPESSKALRGSQPLAGADSLVAQSGNVLAGLDAAQTAAAAAASAPQQGAKAPHLKLPQKATTASGLQHTLSGPPKKPPKPSPPKKARAAPPKKSTAGSTLAAAYRVLSGMNRFGWQGYTGSLS